MHNGCAEFGCELIQLTSGIKVLHKSQGQHVIHLCRAGEPRVCEQGDCEATKKLTELVGRMDEDQQAWNQKQRTTWV